MNAPLRLALEGALVRVAPRLSLVVGPDAGEALEQVLARSYEVHAVDCGGGISPPPGVDLVLHEPGETAVDVLRRFEEDGRRLEFAYFGASDGVDAVLFSQSASDVVVVIAAEDRVAAQGAGLARLWGVAGKLPSSSAPDAELEAHRRELEAVRGSLSWKVTAPLRAAKRRIGEREGRR